MSDFFALYFTSCLIAPMLFFMFYCDRSDKIVLDSTSAAFRFFVILAFWPAAALISLCVHIFDRYKERAKQKIQDLKYKYDYNGITREYAVGIPEKDLKMALTLYRKNTLSLKSEAIQIIREELMNRNAEKELMS